MRYACLYELWSMTPSGRKKPISILDSPEAAGVHCLFGLNRQQLTSLMADFEAPAYRAKQLSGALYNQWEEDLGEVSTLPKTLNRASNDS